MTDISPAQDVPATTDPLPRRDTASVGDTAPVWDLSDLYSGPDDPRLFETLTTVKQDAETFATTYKGKIASLSPAELRDAIATYEGLYQILSHASAFSGLRFAADTAPENGALLQKVREQATAASIPLLFFDLELRALPAETLEGFQNAPELASYRHYLTVLRSFAPFRLTEPEERILSEFANTGSRAFERLHSELTANLRFTVEGHEEPVTLSEVLDFQSSADRNLRKAASDSLTTVLTAHSRTYAFIYNTLVADKATEDRLRGHTYPEENRHLSNELTPETVETVVQVAEGGFPLVARYYHRKRELLGVETLFQYDRYAPLSDTNVRYSYDDARTLILSAFANFHPDYHAAASAFFDNPWMDVGPRPGKESGAFCSYVTPDHHPYIFLNYLGKMDDVLTVAHELGHGIHSYLSRGQTYLNFHGTLPMAEVASTFAEQLVFDALVTGADSQTRFAAYGRQIEGSFATIFRQAMIYRFEQNCHKERREIGELSVERFGELWQEQGRRMFADSVTLEPGHAIWWAYISHMVSVPFYVYAYSFGEMLALALYQKYRDEGATFAPKYLDMLRAGGSQSPAELVAPLGIDLTDAAFWQGAITLLERKVAAFEQLTPQPNS